MTGRPGGRSPFPPTNTMTHDFAIPSAPSRSSSTTLNQSSSQPALSFDPPFDSAFVPSHHSLASKSHQQAAQQLLLDNSDSLIGNNHHGLQHTTNHLLQGDLAFDLIPFTNVRHEPRVSPHEPWNPVDAVTVSMNSQPDQTLPNLEQTRKRPHTDSGYASSRKSRQLVSLNPQINRSLEGGQIYADDEPIGSAAQQNYLLPDQKRRQPSSAHVIPPSSVSPSVAAEPTQSASGIPSFRCEECIEAFNTKSEMSKHMARHNKKFVCDFDNCPRRTDGFATKNDLDRHKGSVHQDAAVTRKEFRCCVPGCKDPNKTWNRKDNFKAHVKRMHPNVDLDDIVERSFQGESMPPTSTTLGQTGSHLDLSQSSFERQSSNALLPQTPLAGNINYNNPYQYSSNPDLFGEGDMYDGPSSVSGQPQYQQTLDINTYRSSTYVPNQSFPPSATIGQSYASSNTVAPAAFPHDPMRSSIMSHRETLAPFTFAHNSANMGNTRPADVQTAPLMGQGMDDFQNNFLDWSPGDETPSVVEGGISAIDPSLQTEQIGSWDLSSQPAHYPSQAEISDQQLPSSLRLATDEPQTQGPPFDHRCAAVVQELMKILQPISPEQVKLMVETYQRHPPVASKDTCAVKSALDIVASRHAPGHRPYQCARDGCSKSFAQKNIRTKHEKRHDRLFFCTWDGCYSTFGSKDDLRRHERKKHERQVFEGWRCFHTDVPTSQHRLKCSQFFEDKEKFQQHRREDHRERSVANNGGLKALKHCHVHQGQPGHFWCGFCDKVILNELSGVDGTKRDKFRYDHIDQHITKEKMTMSQWVDLKSEGLKKTQVKSQSSQQAGVCLNDESGDEEDTDGPSPEASATLDNSSSRVLATSSQHPGIPSLDGRGRKRAHSDADFHHPGPAAKVSRISNYQAPGQAPSMSRGISDMAPCGSTTLFGSNVNRRSPTQLTWVVCCRCTTRRLASSGVSCGSSGCFHPRCHVCTYYDNTGSRLYPRSNSGMGPGSSG